MSSRSCATLLTDWIARDPRAARIELDRELVRLGGLRAFTKLAWPCVEGAKPFVPGWHLDAIAEHLEAVSAGQIHWLIINIPPRHMKLIADDVPIATPAGYRCHGEIGPGDLVFGPDGKPTRVLAVSSKGLADYEVECSTGEVIPCNGEHLWTVWNPLAGKWKTLNTRTLASLQVDQDCNHFFLPDTEPLGFEAGRGFAQPRRRAIVAIRLAANPKSGHCLKVERADGLYVVGRTNLVTHNSTSVSVMWPVWDWLRRPWRQFLTISYAQDLATRDAVKARRIIQSRWFQETFGDRFRLTSDQNAKERYENNRGGYRIATAIDAKLTGEGGDIIIIDDPLNAKDKDSVTKRVGANTWLDESASSRLNDQRTGAFVLVMQRLHEQDMTGHVLAREREGGGEVVHLCLPARYDSRHPFLYAKDPRTRDGELLWPARFPEKALRRLEMHLGAFAAAGQLQQRPTPREGGLFDIGKVTIIDAMPAQRYRRVRAWDLAASVAKTQKEDPDYTVSADVRIGEDGFTYVVEIDRGRWGPDDVEKRIVATASRDGTDVRIWLPQDPGQAGKAQAQRFVRLLAGYAVKTEPVTGDKVVRANPLAAQWAAGNVRILRGLWNEDFLTEAQLFPRGAHDDQVDAVASAYNALAGPLTGLLEFYEQRVRLDEEKPAQDSWHIETIHYGAQQESCGSGGGM